MILSRRKRRHSLGFAMTPMIDIVFLLIIFFMTVSQATQVMQQPLPLARVSEGVETSRPSIVSINLDRQGQLILDGQPGSLDAIMSRLRHAQQTDATSGSRPQIELRIHRDCPSEHVNRVARRLAAQGFRLVRMAVHDANDSASEKIP